MKKRGFAALGLLLAAGALGVVLAGRGLGSVPAAGMKADMMDRFDMAVSNVVSDSLEGVLHIGKVYWLRDEDQVAPAPDPGCRGRAETSSEMGPVLDRAEEMLGLTDNVFTEKTEIVPGSGVRYYLDDTIFSVSWKEFVGGSVYSFAEVKIAHPSQFRRFLADGKYGSFARYTTTDMARSVQAVTASSGDFYSYRPMGYEVCNRVIYRDGSNVLDTCLVDGNGDLNFCRKDEIPDGAALARYVEENDIRFTLAFGPILVEDDQTVAPHVYEVGQPDENYSRAALCQQGPLHYLIVISNMEYERYQNPTIPEFAEHLRDRGIHNAYALDGGQTATLVTNGEMVNAVDYGNERLISDIIYFATAVPETGGEKS